ncbi:MAG: CPBP family intramembrane glutamic endopeptidase [Myxococcota bacterium]|nr:CPBP family intramembrane glutamic endopeptidase [Myxococcota bacterium]
MASPVALVVITWFILDTAPLLVPIVGSDYATFFAFSACTAVVLVSQNPFRPNTQANRFPRQIISFISALISGWALGPLLAAMVVGIGLQLGWQPARPLDASLIGLVSTLLLAPVFEELLYRDRLFVWLTINSTTPMALAVSSLAFALPHPGAISKLAAFLAGMILASTRLLSHGWLPCFGFHVGLNVFGQLVASVSSPAILRCDVGVTVGVPALALAIFLSRTKTERTQ